MKFQKNQKLEKILTKINMYLTDTEKNTLKDVENFPLPSILLIGTPRSGSTLLLQWLASLGVFAYPSNFLSRLYGAPYIGALIYEMITNPIYNYRNEFSDINNSFRKKSSIGKTEGFKSPHEFWYFWRQHFQFPEIPTDNETFLKNADFTTFNKELSLIQSAFGKPFVCKGHLINPYLRVAADNLENVIYLHHTRDPIANIRSLLQARIEWHDDKNEWFSFKPREYNLIKDMDIYHQVAGQIYFMENEIYSSVDKIKDRYIKISYEDFCTGPENFLNQLLLLVNKYSQNFDIKPEYQGDSSYKISRPKTKFDEKKIANAYDFFVNKYGKYENS